MWAVPPGGAGNFSGDAALITSGTIAIGRLGTGTPSNTKFLRGDNVWANPLTTYPDLASRPTASTFNAGQCLVAHANYIILSVSDGTEWFSYGKSTLLVDRPSAVTFGKGNWQIDGKLYLSDGANWLEAMVADVNGDVVANLVPRTNTLAQLLQVVGTAGELASATDTNAIVKFTGNTVGGSVFRPQEPYTAPCLGSVEILLNMPTGATGYALAAGNDFNPLTGGLVSNNAQCGLAVIKSGVALMGSFDFINWFKMVSITSSLPMFTVSGDTVFSTDLNGSNVAQVLRSPYSTWSSTAALHATITTWSQPIPLENKSTYTSALTYDTSGTSGAYAVIVGNPAVSVTQYTLPEGLIFTATSAVSEFRHGYDGLTNKMLGFVVVIAGTNKYLLGYAGGGITGASATLPAVVTTPVILTLGDALVIYDKANNVFYSNKKIVGGIGATVGSYGEGSTAVDHAAWETFQGPPAIAAGQGLCVCNKRLVAVYSNAGVFISDDLLTWKTMQATGVVPTTATAIPAGIVFTRIGESYLALYANDGGIYPLANPHVAFGVGPTRIAYGNKLFNFGSNSRVISLDPLVERTRVTVQSATATTQNITYITALHECTATASAAMTINLPPNPHPGMVVVVKVNSVHTALTFGTQAAPANQTIKGGATYSAGTNVAGAVYTFTFWGQANDWSVAVS